MAIEITWSRVALITEFEDPTSAGICNMGGRLAMVAGATWPPGLKRGAVYYSDDDGQTWSRGSDLGMFSEEGVGSDPSDSSTGLLCYKQPGVWVHPEDGNGFLYFGSSGDTGGVLRSHENDVGAGMPIFLVQGWAKWGRPCLARRKDMPPDRKFAIWPGSFIYWTFGEEPTGPILLELSQGGATSLTTAFILNQLDPQGGFMAAGQYPDGSITWLWVTTPPRLSPGSPTDGWDMFMVATQDGVIWRIHGPSQLHLNGRPDPPGSAYNRFTDAFFTRSGVLLCGVNVSGLSPCIFRSTDGGISVTEIVLPGNFFNYIPQGGKGSFIFSGLFVMTHCFCELDDGTILCGGGAPTAIGSNVHSESSQAYHYPVVWRTTDDGLTWENISLNVADFGTRLPNENSELWEARILLALGGQAALMITHLDLDLGAGGDWTPFYVTEDGGESWVKSMAPRVGLLSLTGGDDFGRPFLYPIQATYANDGSILVVMTDWLSQVEIWRGTRQLLAEDEHRAVGFMEQSDLEEPVSISNFVIPDQERIRG